MKCILTFVFSLIFLLPGLASELEIGTPILYNEDDAYYALVSVSWENAWHTERNHDAVWVFGKFLRGNYGYVHARLQQEGHEVIETNAGLSLTIKASADGAGAFVQLAEDYRGPVKAVIRLEIDEANFDRFEPQEAIFQVFGLEMVHIPAGGHTLGDPDAKAQAYGSIYRSDAEGQSAGLFPITREEEEIKVGPEEGLLYYQAPSGYEGDQTGIIPAAYPKGARAFYCMKYEPTQGQYASFLNSLSENQSQNRAIHGGKTYYQKRGTISQEDGVYIVRNPSRPCNFMSWDDGLAFADWAGLRPMTDLEYTKAARGPQAPIGTEYPWNTDSKALMQRTYDEAGHFIMLNGWTEGQLTDETKAYFGASYYWVMDLAGSTWERVITIGHPKGRSFTGSHGDGRITYYGFATNEDWPQGITETGGFGFRGGGYYTFGRPYSEFNPYSPIAYRRFGGWSGGGRVAAYGQRFVRTAE